MRKELRTPEGLKETLLKIKTNPDEVAYQAKQELVTMGYISNEKKQRTDSVASAGRGRHKIVYELTNKAKALLYPGLAKNWKDAA